MINNYCYGNSCPNGYNVKLVTDDSVEIYTTNDNTLRLHTKKYPGAFFINGYEVYIKEVIYSNPATIILWSDGERTVVKCSSVDTYSEETGLVMCIMKRLCGGKKLKSITNAWLPDVPNNLTQARVTLKEVIKKEKNG